MTTEIAAPRTQTIVRDDKHGGTVVIESLTEKHFEAARKIENEFFGSTGKGCCFGMCPLSWCPLGKEEFESHYRKHPDRCSTYGLAIRQTDQLLLVVGVIALRQGGQASRFDESLLHKPDQNELHVEHLAVTKEARGMGGGTKLLAWAEDKARERKATRLSLGVVRGNPAKRLYDRFGFVEVSTSTCMPAFILGRPHGQFGAVSMEKQVV
jgi:ribosomal protein S18 acetylase RimI-like enzyme